MQHVYIKNDFVIKDVFIECQVLQVLFVKIHAQVINDSHISVYKGVVWFLTILQLCPVTSMIYHQCQSYQQQCCNVSMYTLKLY